EGMFALNFHEKQEEKIEKALKTHKGICENYAAVFNDICNKAGLQSYIVVGYTRQKGFTSFIPHGWCAVKIDGKWKLFDPTWGSGYINGQKFTPHINNEYFEAEPATLVKTHMPFDPIWQLSTYPLTNKDFADDKTAVDKSRPALAFADSIAAYMKLTEIEQLEAEARRLEKNGMTNSILLDRLHNLRSRIEVDHQNELINKQNKVGETFNEAVTEYNDGINLLNDFIDYRNKQFQPARTDAQIQGMVDAVDKKIVGAQAKLKKIKGQYDKIDPMISSLEKSMSSVEKSLGEQKDFLTEYFGKNKLGRKMMFRKYTINGIPLN
ncbi:MAG: hypothetical protein K9G49_15680, partial [Taibaiella sp.]|nr:hypothetical protein [Taibaiella sp.]